MAPGTSVAAALAPLPDADGAIAHVVLHSMRSIALWLSVLFAVFIVTDTVLFDSPTDRVLATFDAVLVVGYLASWWALRRSVIPARYAAPAAGVLLLACMVYLQTVLLLSGQPLQTSGLALWQIGCGMFLLSWPWLMGLLFVSDAVWLAIVWRLPPSDEWGHFGTLLMSANVMAAVIHAIRLRVYQHMEALRRQDKARQRELEAALAQASQVGEMRRLNDLKTRFMNVAAHELATPMTPIMIQLHLLRQKAGALPPEAVRALDVLGRGLERLNALLRDILDGSRLQADRLPLTVAPMDVRAALQESVDAYQPVARASGVTLRLEPGGPLLAAADGARVTQVITNLLSNAVKYTGKGGHVVVEGTDGPGEIRVEVRDNGAGFDPASIAQLFQPFSQLHGTEARRQGTGLGLYISRGIVERHGGTMGASSAGPGKGARFWLTLPKAAA